MYDTSSYYTVEEYAREMKMNPQSIRRAIREKKIIALRPTGSKKGPYRIPKVEIERKALQQMQGEL